MTQRVRHDEREGFRGSSADVPGRDGVPGKGEFLLEFPGTALAAGAFVLCVVRPEVTEALERHLALPTAGPGH
ncbi:MULTISPECIES: hypothetical protein [unclassified Streptomyces]|uniref:hypothetical protein n=1 Tax=unclassified Streptomyces TaxID=2593676 RepID=UPI0008E51B56|nr:MULTISPECIES: hypothetical protein [unclassified Streptomyces]UJV38509.1 hypothetical protein CVT30_00015 [Streptomyces sp. AMCC400023]SFN96262.1 hypothetical protein SAMN04487980_104054 [Streptomyces sp. cf124]